ncbi:hypothetical protein LIER_32960 [Lithospermum erythrorhizon]|uniref:GAG-pre-integrase domain-containing protein n=1 Tax=Lithospermum erythrorhizon TaxID=34254 RepID=A0AAV3RZD5_LITER
MLRIIFVYDGVEVSRGLKMMNPSTNILEEIRVMGKTVGDSTGIGYKRGITSNQKGEMKFVPVDGNQQSSTVVTTQRSKMRTDRVCISQLCDDGMKVFFSKEGCTVNNRCDQIVMKGVRFTDNCYMWTSVKALVSIKNKDSELWHKKLGHTNYRNNQQLISKEAL